MTAQEARALVQTDPLPNEWNGMRKLYEYVHISRNPSSTRKEAQKKLKSYRAKRSVKDGFYCPGGKHRGIYELNGRWYVYQHAARYE